MFVCLYTCNTFSYTVDGSVLNHLGKDSSSEPFSEAKCSKASLVHRASFLPSLLHNTSPLRRMEDFTLKALRSLNKLL